MKIKFPRIDLKKWEFEFQQRDSHPIIMADLWCRSLFNNFKPEIKLSVSKIDYLFTASSKGYIKRKQKRKVILELKKATQTEKYLSYLLKTTQKRIKELESTARKINNRINKGEIGSEELARIWQEFDKVFMRVIPWFYIPWYVIEYNLVTDRVKDKLLEHKKSIENITDFNNALMILVLPIRKALLQKEQDDFYKLVEFTQNKKNFSNNRQFLKQAQDYLKHYAWMKTFLLLPIEPLTLKELVKRISDAIKKRTIEEYKLQKSQKSKNKRLANKLIQLIQRDKSLLNQIKWAQNFGWLLTWSVDQALIATADLSPFFKLTAKHLNVKYSQWVLLTYQEIINHLKGIKPINKLELKKREIGYIFLMEKGKPSMMFGKQAQELSKTIDENVGKIEDNINTVTGQPASPGIVQGKVKIIMMANEANKIKDGDVLVCSMTSPDYVLAMKRAVAVVTDEGGLLCHAAIVSRELGIPCVIGTKIATKVLKDGDLVEVDADKGIIRILK